MMPKFGFGMLWTKLIMNLLQWKKILILKSLNTNPQDPLLLVLSWKNPSLWLRSLVTKSNLVSIVWSIENNASYRRYVSIINKIQLQWSLIVYIKLIIMRSFQYWYLSIHSSIFSAGCPRPSIALQNRGLKHHLFMHLYSELNHIWLLYRKAM